MLVASVDTLKIYVMHDAFALLYNKTNMIHTIDKMNNISKHDKIIFKDEAIYLYEELINKMAVIIAVTYILSNEEETTNSRN